MGSLLVAQHLMENDTYCGDHKIDQNMRMEARQPAVPKQASALAEELLGLTGQRECKVPRLLGRRKGRQTILLENQIPLSIKKSFRELS